MTALASLSHVRVVVDLSTQLQRSKVTRFTLILLISIFSLYSLHLLSKKHSILSNHFAIRYSLTTV